MTEVEKLKAGVKELRSVLGLTQEEYAKAIGKTYATVQRYEQLRPPQGLSLVPFVRLSREAGRDDLAEMFSAALRDDLGDVVGLIYSMTKLKMKSRELKGLLSDAAPTKEESAWLNTWLECMRTCPQRGVQAIKDLMLTLLDLRPVRSAPAASGAGRGGRSSSTPKRQSPKARRKPPKLIDEQGDQ